MSTVRRIAKNTTIFLISNIASYILGFVYLTYAARYLGPFNYGILTFAIAFTNIFSVLTDLGLQQITVRDVARDKSCTEKYVRYVGILKIILGILTFVLIVITGNLLGYPQYNLRVLYIFGISIFLQAFVQLFYSIFRAYEKIEYESIGLVLNSSIVIIGLVIVTCFQWDVVALSSMYMLASFISLVYIFTVYIRKFSMQSLINIFCERKIEWSTAKSIFKGALPFGLATVFVAIYYWISTVILSMVINSEVVGWYSAAYRLAMIPLFIPVVYNAVLFPIMSKIFISSANSLKVIYSKSLKYMVILAIPMGLGGTLISDKLVMLVFGSEYQQSIMALQILIWSTALIFINSIPSILLQSTNKQLTITKVTGINALLNLTLNVLLIPQLSYIGASIVNVITELSALIIGIVIVSKMGFGLSKKDLYILMKVIAGNVLMGIFIVLYHDINIVLLILLSIILYFAVILLLRILDKQDIATIKFLFPNR